MLGRQDRKDIALKAVSCVCAGAGKRMLYPTGGYIRFDPGCTSQIKTNDYDTRETIKGDPRSNHAVRDRSPFDTGTHQRRDCWSGYTDNALRTT